MPFDVSQVVKSGSYFQIVNTCKKLGGTCRNVLQGSGIDNGAEARTGID
jgi:hypothetical protein